MMICTSRSVIFLAGQRCASTSIEWGLRRFFEIAINETIYGKHMTYMEMERRFAWLFEARPLKDYFIFGVMRDPVDWVLSLYNFHHLPWFDVYPELSTKGMSMFDFLNDWSRRNRWQSRAQHKIFVDRNDVLAVDYLIDFTRLHEQFMQVCEFLGLGPIEMTVKKSISPKVLTRADLAETEMHEIYRRYSTDQEIYRNSTGRLVSNKIWRPARGVPHVWHVVVVVDRSALPSEALSDPEFWYIGAHDVDGKEIYREDLRDEEMQRLLAGAAPQILINRWFESETEPVKWTVWPFSRSAGWLDKIEGAVNASILPGAPGAPP